MSSIAVVRLAFPMCLNSALGWTCSALDQSYGRPGRDEWHKSAFAQVRLRETAPPEIEGKLEIAGGITDCIDRWPYHAS